MTFKISAIIKENDILKMENVEGHLKVIYGEAT